MNNKSRQRFSIILVSLGLSLGGILSTPVTANAALKWHKGTPTILAGKRYRAKPYVKKLGPVVRHFEWITGTKSTMSYNGFQWGMKRVSTSYKKSGNLYLVRGRDRHDKKQVDYLKIKKISAKKVRVNYGGTDINGHMYFLKDTVQTMTRF